MFQLATSNLLVHQGYTWGVKEGKQKKISGHHYEIGKNGSQSRQNLQLDVVGHCRPFSTSADVCLLARRGQVTPWTDR